MKLSILMPALKKRNHKQLKKEILSQIEKFPDDAELIIREDSGEETSGTKRNILTQSAQGEYICFVDDDDMVSENYVSSILNVIKSNSPPDVITFNLQFIKDGNPREVWKFGLWANDRRRGRMCANHLCAWRKAIATQVAWCEELGNWDDHLWFEPIYYAGLPETYQHIPEVLYYYQYSSSGTENQDRERVRQAQNYVGGGLRCYNREYDPKHTIMIEVGGSQRYSDDSNILVRDKYGNCMVINPKDYNLFHTIRRK